MPTNLDQSQLGFQMRCQGKKQGQEKEGCGIYEIPTPCREEQSKSLLTALSGDLSSDGRLGGRWGAMNEDTEGTGVWEVPLPCQHGAPAKAGLHTLQRQQLRSSAMAWVTALGYVEGTSWGLSRRGACGEPVLGS